MVGTALNHYRIIKAIGSGGMGEVYLAEDTRLKRLVALKMLPASLAAHPDRRERFEREAQAVAALNHQNIVTVYSVEQAAETLFLTMEYVDGRTLGDLLPSGGLPLKRLLALAKQIVDAVVAAHEGPAEPEYVASAFPAAVRGAGRRTVTVRLKPDTTYIC